MSNMPYGGMPAGPAPWPQPGPPPSRGPSRWPVVLALVVAVVAVAVAIASWFRPVPHEESTTPTFTAQQTNDAKSAVCDAFGRAHKALLVNSTKSSSDPAISGVYAVNGRLGIHAAGDYLFMKISDNPAAPKDFIESVKNLATTWQEITLDQIAEADQTRLDSEYDRADKLVDEITQGCQ